MVRGSKRTEFEDDMMLGCYIFSEVCPKGKIKVVDDVY